MLRINQQKAIKASISNQFDSGIHFHATGTGKSWISLQLAIEFQQYYKNLHNKHCVIFWICEQKSILVEQFSKETLKQKGFDNIHKIFFVKDYSIEKSDKWVQQVNSSYIWGKSILVIINRAFLTSSNRYTHIQIPINLVIHDECHSITNETTTQFYNWLQEYNSPCKVIGFSATPIIKEPFNKIISSYTIYDAYKDDIIVQPKIIWLKKQDGIISQYEVRELIKKVSQSLPYRKIIVWCGMIDTVYNLAIDWSKDSAFKDWTFAIDTSSSLSQLELDNKFVDYEEFRKCTTNAFLFCASKHREGSDIPNLDACIFLDRVTNRNAKTFIQCMGRVLRKDTLGLKKHGLIVDLCANSPMKVCDRVHQFINPYKDSSINFPFHYSLTSINSIQIHSLDMIKSNTLVMPIKKELPYDIRSLFIRKLPDNIDYIERLSYEIDLFKSKNLFSYINQALEILQITKNIPHVTRGSCGSSLVCYMLGISHIDPIKWNIRFARFLNEFRDTLPDIDFDFPHNLRDEVFLQIQMKWPGRVARISNHVYYHKKSALREAIRISGIRKMIPTLQITDTLRKLPQKQQHEINKKTKELEDSFRCYSLHCGGIVFYPDGIPKEIRLESKNGVMPQIILNKHDIAKEKHFKIDILSSRALSQLCEARRYAGLPEEIDFEEFITDKKTAELFRCGDNIGITLAESPLIRKAFMLIQPDTIELIALCLAIIRPAAKDARFSLNNKISKNVISSMLVYDDDAIDILVKALGCTEAEADKYRRGFAKDDKKICNFIKRKADKKSLEKIKNLRKYSFCKSHAYSYAQLVWQLGYMKANYPVAFWKATLKHNESMYRKWVHLYEAACVGLNINNDSQYSKSISIYAENRRKTIKKEMISAEPSKQLLKLGIWKSIPLFFPGTYIYRKDDRWFIRGIIASSRIISGYDKIKTACIFVGVGPKEYIEVIVNGKNIFMLNKVGITCKAIEKSAKVFEVSTKDAIFW